MKVNKEIRASQKHIKSLFTSATIMIFLGLITLVFGFFQLLGFGVLFLVIAYMFQNLILIKLLDGHMELKFGPLAGTKYIKYSDVHELKKESAKKVILYYKNGDSLKKISIPVQIIEQNDLSDFMSVIDKHVKS